MRSFGYSDSSDRFGKTASEQQTPIGPSAHWSTIRRHAQSDVLANKARNYILQMLQQDQKSPPR
jgi:hypothetical protein